MVRNKEEKRAERTRTVDHDCWELRARQSRQRAYVDGVDAMQHIDDYRLLIDPAETSASSPSRSRIEGAHV
jgi:hypothetical protein